MGLRVFIVKQQNHKTQSMYYHQKHGEIAVKHGFKILHIWEKDYRENKEQIINKSLKFLIND